MIILPPFRGMRWCLLGLVLFAGLLLGPSVVQPQKLEPPAGRREEAAAPRKMPASLRVAAVQMRSSRDLAENVTHIQKFLRRCGKDGVRVAVFPECALTGYYNDLIPKVSAEQLAEAERRVARTCREAGIYAVIGTPHRAADKLFNSAVVIDPAGKVLERYHKVQLAESWPEAGDHLSVFKVDGVPCCIIICHDERYPALVRLPVLAGARVLFYLSHESDIRAEHKINPYRAQIQARAVENTIYIVHANAPANRDATGSHGQSRLIAPDGNLLREASLFGEEVLAETFDLSKATAENAKRSLRRGPLTQWWREGLKQVRMVE
ncbi:MAG TPA: carbon-nitrogen hydrolase family protein [Gemmataceae bacterium]|nr:carbon-nitrogen hydrolase family protein [Gemmataceae bacterium]